MDGKNNLEKGICIIQNLLLFLLPLSTPITFSEAQQQQKKERKRIPNFVEEEKTYFGRTGDNPIKETQSFKMTIFVLNSSKVHYFNLDLATILL